MRCLYLLTLSFLAAAQSPDAGWPAYGHDAGGTRFSPLTRVTPANVANLRVAWTYHTGALEPKTDLNHKAAFESTPILIDGLLYVTTPFNAVIALDPATGAEKWKYDPDVPRGRDYSEVTNRGVAAWVDSQAAPDAPCRLRLFEGTIDAHLLAIDGKTGKPCSAFAKNGAVELWRGVDIRDFGDYEVTSAPTVIGDLVIVGSSIGDNRAVDVERGVVRAYDARTGALRWTWDPIPWANQQRLRTGAANAWSTFAADPARDLVFIPTGSASPDFYGGIRPGDNRYANSVVALRASTGRLVWAFQVVHHDLWDYDVASQPSLIQFQGRPAVAVNTKMGNFFVLDRETGKPLHKVDERPVPKSDVPGEESSPTQPMPAWPALVPQKITPDELWGPTPDAVKWCRQQIEQHRNEGIFTPPSLKGSLVVPGNIGGANWGSAAWDPGRHLIFVNTNRFITIVKLMPREDLPDESRAARDQHRDIEFGRQLGAPYAMSRDWLVSPAGTPCNAPPWGALVAFDLAAGKIKWQSPVGGDKQGSPTLGGPIATASGLAFTAAGRDTYLRAFDSATGAELWKGELPASAQSTPMTYEIDGKQYIVICAGGHGKLGTKMGDSVVAFALP
jgi:quinoprotein glucose dehydrogenase